MIYRLLLAFFLLSALTPLRVAVFSPEVKADETVTVTVTSSQEQECDIVNDPQSCPKATSDSSEI